VQTKKSSDNLIIYAEIFFYALVFFTVFFLVFPRAVKDYSIPNFLWYIDVSRNSRSFRDFDVKIIPEFRINHYFFSNRLFYYDQTGDLLHQMNFDSSMLVSASASSYLAYQKVGEKIFLHDKNGNPVWEYPTHSYPLISPSGSIIALLSTDNTMLQIIDKNRNTILAGEALTMLLTDFAWCKFNESLCLGTLDGLLYYYDFNGRLLYKAKAPASRIPFVKSVAVSAEGNFTGSIAGIGPEYLCVYDKKGALKWKTKTRLERRNPVSLFIDEYNGLVAEQTPLGVRLYSLENGRQLYTIDIDDFLYEKIFYFKADSVHGKILLCFSTSSGSFAMLVNNRGRLIWKQRFRDTYMLQCEIEPKYESFQIQGSSCIYCIYLSEPFIKEQPAL